MGIAEQQLGYCVLRGKAGATDTARGMRARSSRVGRDLYTTVISPKCEC